MNIIDMKLSTVGDLQWGNKPNKIILHHPEWYGDVVALNRMMQNMGFVMIGYNFYVRKDGSVYQGRPVDAVGGNCYGQNTQSIGVCFEGNYEKDAEMPQAQFDAGIELIQHLKTKYGISEVNGHKAYVSTACPGKNFPLSEMIKASNGAYTEPAKPIAKPEYVEKSFSGRVTASALNVRSGAGTNYNVISSLANGIVVSIIGESGEWYKISSPNGYVSKQYIEIIQAPSGSESIRTVQRTLNQLGYRDDSGRVLAEDGIPGVLTKQALAKAIIRRGANNALVGIIQKILGCSVDNVYGNAPYHETYDAIVRFQRDNGLSADSIVGINTWSKLLRI